MGDSAKLNGLPAREFSSGVPVNSAIKCPCHRCKTGLHTCQRASINTSGLHSDQVSQIGVKLDFMVF